jgi:hypothetical protein
MEDTERHKVHRLNAGMACYLDSSFQPHFIVNNIPAADIRNITIKFDTVYLHYIIIKSY